MNTAGDYIHGLLGQLQTASSDEALQLLADAANAHPADARPLLLLAAEFMERRDTDRAEAAYSAALLIAPEFAIARFQLGLLQFTSGRPAVAQVTWAGLEQLPEGDPLRLFKRGMEALAIDEFTAARALLRDGIAANTSNPPLNRDMEMLIAHIATLENPGSAGPAVQADPGESHFLLSAYGRVH
ncbi:MAG TPA: hypothetical protein VNB23_11420 [Ramlibacter sp.]|nr:hypothetical protein [Ramlibacter sp.]